MEVECMHFVRKKESCTNDEDVHEDVENIHTFSAVGADIDGNRDEEGDSGVDSGDDIVARPVGAVRAV